VPPPGVVTGGITNNQLINFPYIGYMNAPCATEYPQFFTASIYNWLPLLHGDKYKNIITGSLQFLVQHKRIELNAFVIMNNHIHLIWQPLPGHTLKSIQLSFMKFTAQQLKFAYTDDNNPLIEQCRVNKTDREYQVWKRKPLSIELHSESVFFQKLEYIHYNPVKAGLCHFPEEYYYSSALFYEKGIDHFNMLSHYLT
jgi:REP element-mobilizing transposase RayT